MNAPEPTTVTQTEPTQPISHARMLCKVAAAVAQGLPTPMRIYIFDDRSSLDLNFPQGNLDAIDAWQRAIEQAGGSNFDRRSQEYTHQGDDPLAGRTAELVNCIGRWHGWRVNLSGLGAPSQGERLDADDPDVALILAHADGAEVAA